MSTAILAVALCGGLLACSGPAKGTTTNPGAQTPTTSPDDLASQIGALPTPAGLTTTAPAPLEETPVAGAAPTIEPAVDSTVNGRPLRTTVALTRYTASARYDTQVLLNPMTDVIYPGSVLLGGSIENGTYREMARGEKGDIVVSYGGLNGISGKGGGPGVVSRRIQPTLSAFRALHGEVMSQTLSGASTTYTLQAMDASTSDSFDLHFGLGVSIPSPIVTANIKSNFDFAKETTRNRYLIRFAQTFYTVDVDQSTGLRYRSCDVSDFEGSRPVYVASIAYGRLAFITLESTASKEIISAGINAIIEAPQVALETSASTEVKAVQSASNLNITVIGSDRVVTTLAGFKDFLEKGGFSATNTGQIVAYKLRFVDDNSVANVVYAGEYTRRTVTETTGVWDVRVRADGIMFADTDGSRERDMVDLMGSLVVDRGGESYELWARPRSNLGLYPDDATSYTDLTGDVGVKEARFSASSLDDALRFRTVDVYDFNFNNKSVPYGPADQSFTLARARADGNHVEVTANRADGQLNRWVKFRVAVEATPTF